MQYQITSDNIQPISPSMHALAEDKLQRLDNMLSKVHADLKNFRIVMNSIPDNQYEVKIKGVVHGKEYFAQDRGYTLEHAVVAAVDLLARMMEKDKMVSTSEDWKDAREAKREPLSKQDIDEIL